MTFEEWYDKQGDVEIDYALLQAAWNAALDEAANLVEEHDAQSSYWQEFDWPTTMAFRIHTLKEKP